MAFSERRTGVNAQQGTQGKMEQTEIVFAFGPFCLRAKRRLLLKRDHPVPIGSRALEILIALIERSGELVTKEELFTRAWPHTIVEESSLRAQVAALRRALRDDSDDSPYVLAVPGQGYRFVGSASQAQTALASPSTARVGNLPVRLTSVVGRAETIELLETRLQRCRFVTVIGPGGVGKTTVAVATAAKAASSYQDGVYFFDASALTESSLLPSVLASSLGVSIVADDVTDRLTKELLSKQLLIVLDNCERIAEATARLAERILKAAPEVRLLVTSREPLRAEGESVHRLAPLDAPPRAAGTTASEALRFSAVELFVERAASTMGDFQLTDFDAAVVADICRQLDGLPLAIELAAGRLDAYGLRGIAERLDDRLRFLKGGRRSAIPRHQTLLATLEWSYEALSADEKAVLEALAIFAGSFSFDAAAAVTLSQEKPIDIIDIMASLVSKSLVSADVHRHSTRYRLPESTRVYALERLEQGGEREVVTRAHATYIGQIFQQALSDWEIRDPVDWLADYAPESDSLRAVLEWAFSPGGDAALGIELTVAAIPLWFRLSATDECRTCVQRALDRVDQVETHEARTRQVMQLYAALGLSRTFTLGLAPQAKAAWHKSLELAERLDDRESQREALWGLWLCQLGDGDYREALSTAQAYSALADAAPDMQMADRLLGVPRHCLGEHSEARLYIERGLDIRPSLSPVGVRFRFGQPMAARVILAQILWLQGFPDRALETARYGVRESRASGHAISLCDALAQSMCPIALRVGDYELAESSIGELEDLTERYALGPWSILSQCWKAALHIERGERDVGIPVLTSNLKLLREARFAFYHTQFMGILAAAIADCGDVVRGLAMIDEALTRCKIREELWCLPEILRLKGEILALAKDADNPLVEDYFRRSLRCAQQQRALSWELRAAMSLADLQRRAGLIDRAGATVADVYQHFTEGFVTVDLKTAQDLIGITKRAS
jgi:predicted ATPase/DNA-binding winged helix-turn-helix (wHTH) protein